MANMQDVIATLVKNQNAMQEQLSEFLKSQQKGKLPAQVVKNPNVNMVTLTSENGREKEVTKEDTHAIYKHDVYDDEEVASILTNCPFPFRLLNPWKRKPKERNVNAITLKSGKLLNETPKRRVVEEKEKEVIPPESPIPIVIPFRNPIAKKFYKGETSNSTPQQETPPPLVTTPPFPSRLKNNKKEEEEKELLEIFRKMEINLPLLKALEQIPKYAKFLKELCTNKRKVKGKDKVKLGENVSAIFQKKLPPKCKDPGMFTVPCKIGDLKIDNAMLDLGASINVMPYSVYEKLNLGPLNNTSVTIQLADKSKVIPRGVLEDVLVKVDKLMFPGDFYVIDLEDHASTPLVLLGRPFMKTAMTKIDVHAGKLSMEVEGDVINFDITSTKSNEEGVLSIYQLDLARKIGKEGENDKGLGKKSLGLDGKGICDGNGLGNGLNGKEGLVKGWNGIGIPRDDMGKEERVDNGDGDGKELGKKKSGKKEGTTLGTMERVCFGSIKEMKKFVNGNARNNGIGGRKGGGVKVDPPIVTV